ncbi:MAG: hypothetical protein ACKVHE_34555 [Planctomycetales bacterium]
MVTTHRWAPLTALIAGPVIAVTPWAADVFMYHRDMYPAAFREDAVATLSVMILTGAFTGVATAVVFAIAFTHANVPTTPAARQCRRLTGGERDANPDAAFLEWSKIRSR